MDSFGGGQAGPEGLSAYLHQLKGQSPALSYVLLVGGSVYDHTDKLGTGALTFIPGHYTDSHYSNYTVSDVPYVSDPEDSTLFAHIGRWPVRSDADLQVIVAKTLNWSDDTGPKDRALLIAEHTIENEGIDFGQALDGVADTLPAGISRHRVYVDDLLSVNEDDNPDNDITEAEALAQAKGMIIDELNAFPDIVLYNGHASTRQLSNQNLFKATDIA